MNETMDTILLEALDLLEQGVSVDEITARYPAQSAELRPFLLTAVALSRLATQPAAVAEARSKRAFLDSAGHAAERPTRRAAGLWRRLALPVMALVAFLFLGTAGLVGASASATPGDTLYGAKLFVERARLGLTADPERAAALREQFRQERVREVEQLLAAGREADVSLTGPIEAMSGMRWTVAGVPVVILPGTVIDGAPTLGAEAQIDGRAALDVVEAARVTIMVAAGPQPRPQPTADGRPTTAAIPTDDDNGMDEPMPGGLPVATVTRTPAATATPAATVTASPTMAPSATATPAPTEPPPTDTPPSAAPQPTTPPTPSATPDDDDDNSNDNDGENENDNDDDNANDNGGDDNQNDNDDDNANDNGDDDNQNDNDDDNANDNGGDDNQNDNDDENANDNGDDDNENDNANDNGGDDNENDNDDNSGSGGGDNDNDNGGGDDDQND